MVAVIHAAAAKFGFFPCKAGGFNNVHGGAQTRAKAHGGPNVLGNIGVDEGKGGHEWVYNVKYGQRKGG